MHQNKRIINIDETIINQTDQRKRGWASYGAKNIVTHSQRLLQVNMIAAISNWNEVFYTVNNGQTNSTTFLYFICKLIQALNQQDKNWRNTTIIILDNATYHKNQRIFKKFKKLKIPLMFLGAYQFKLAPVELFFSFLKNRDLNPLNCRAYSKFRGYMDTYLKELALHINKLDLNWISKCFYHIMPSALDSISMKDL